MLTGSHHINFRVGGYAPGTRKTQTPTTINERIRDLASVENRFGDKIGG
jgi:hypothetical protein